MHLPPHPDVTFRPFAGPSDYPGLAALINRAWKDAGVESVQTPERLRSGWERPAGWDPRRDAVIVEREGTIAGYGRVEVRRSVDGHRTFYTVGWLDPRLLRRGIGTVLLAANLDRIAELADSPHSGDQIEMFSMSRQPGADALARANGFEAAAYEASMIRTSLDELPEPSMPEGFTVRPPAPEELRAVWEADRAGFRDHFGAYELSDDHYANWLATETDDPSLWQVAWEGDQAVSQVRVFIDDDENEAFSRRRGWTEDISTLPAYRRRGLARGLLVLGLHALAERGMTEAALTVHTDNLHGAKGLYESVGFEVDRVMTTYRRPLTLA